MLRARRRFGKSEPEIRALLAAARKELATARAGRPHPPLDDKVLVAWNGLMISAFARAAQVLDEPRYADAARASAAFIESRMYDPKTNLLQRRYRDGAVEIDALAEDYAFLTQGVLDLYETSFEVKWLSWAIRLQEQQDALFWDGKGGGYFATRADAAHVLVRMKENFDGDVPAASSVAAMNLLRLWQMTDRAEWRDKADATFAAFAGRLGSQGTAVPSLVSALDFSLSKPRQILIAGDPGAADTRAMLRLVHERFIPNKILLVADGGPGQQQLARWLSGRREASAAGTAGRRPISARTTCASCRQPTSALRRSCWTARGNRIRSSEGYAIAGVMAYSLRFWDWRSLRWAGRRA